MSTPATDSRNEQSPSTVSESSGGFKSFWRKSERHTPSQDVQFVQQDPSTKRKSRGIGRLFSSSTSGPASPGSSENSGDIGKRRQQVYQAQKRHRNRKVEYVQSLEAEVARLQHLDATVNSERNTIAIENEKLRALLAAGPAEAQLDSLKLDQQDLDISMLGGATVNSHYDEFIGHERWFMDIDDLTDSSWTSTDDSDRTETNRTETNGTSHHNLAIPVDHRGDSWAALDFIMALEWPCKSHVHHHAINPDVSAPLACDVGKFHGHAFTTTQAVFQSSMPPSTQLHRQNPTSLEEADVQQVSASNNCWQLPHSEIDKCVPYFRSLREHPLILSYYRLVFLSAQLPLDDEQVTPAKAYAEIKRHLPEKTALRPVLDAMKITLSKAVNCSGFGAWMPIETFQACLKSVTGIDIGISI
ncbi:hypothetical protein LTR78_001994 [Recurvomyces mirabilis]|uniref:BZIP domain-containing protein n=1 Tax=Recurvomyces mirabilis TaxID=574656 RepID=A0AAE1C4H4_9PEZI|nr:hypothetical protein LTR78_001994 [Recurvomyces mirabilis]